MFNRPLWMNRKIVKNFTILGLFLIIGFGFYQIYYMLQFKENEYADLVRLGNTCAAMLPTEDLKSLHAQPSDTALLAYVGLKNTLQSVIKVNSQASFAYLFKISDGKIYFIADSEPAGSDNYSPPGQMYNEATSLDLTLMQDNAVPIVEHSSDRWGKWVSILVPVHDPKTGKHIAVFGLDFNAHEWMWRIYYKVILSVLIVLLAIMAFIFILVISNKSKLLQLEVEKLKDTEQNLLVANAKAEESNRLKTAFLNNMSHEIRTPLNAIVGFAGLLENKDVSDEDRALYLKYVLTSSERLLQTLGDILELSRLQTAKDKAPHTGVNLIDTISNVAIMYKKQAHEKGLQFQLKLSDSETLSSIQSNAGYLVSILHKLLSNAVKFTDTGSIEVGCYLKDSAAIVYVKDTGIGVDVKKHPFIFDEFRQVYESNSRNYDGNGLGLNIAKRLVNILGGEIFVTSNGNKGSIFSFTIPIR